MTEEERKAYMKKYRAEHKEEIKASKRYWYKLNRTRLQQKNKEYYKTHKPLRSIDPEASRLACKKYYHSHKNDPEYKAKQKANHDRWIEKNRDKWNAYQRERIRKLREQV